MFATKCPTKNIRHFTFIWIHAECVTRFTYFVLLFFFFVSYNPGEHKSINNNLNWTSNSMKLKNIFNRFSFVFVWVLSYSLAHFHGKFKIDVWYLIFCVSCTFYYKYHKVFALAVLAVSQYHTSCKTNSNIKNIAQFHIFIWKGRKKNERIVTEINLINLHPATLRITCYWM